MSHFSRFSGHTLRLSAASATLLSLAFATPAAHAQANLSFGGGSGSPLSLTLAQSVTYTITATTNFSAPFFVFDAVGSFLGNNVTGSLTYTVNGGAPITFDFITGGFTGGAVTADDPAIYNTTVVSEAPNLPVGTVLVLNAGTLTTIANVPTARPANGTFTTFITDQFGDRLSSNGVSAITAAPEPGTVALVAMGLMGTAGMVIRRRK